MQQEIVKSGKIKLILLIALFAVLTYWTIAGTTDVYAFAVAGALYEILWLPVLLAGFAIPVISVIYWYKEKLRITSMFLYLGIFSVVLNALLVSS